jgi:hypothetical protein
MLKFKQYLYLQEAASITDPLDAEIEDLKRQMKDPSIVDKFSIAQQLDQKVKEQRSAKMAQSSSDVTTSPTKSLTTPTSVSLNPAAETTPTTPVSTSGSTPDVNATPIPASTPTANPKSATEVIQSGQRPSYGTYTPFTTSDSIRGMSTNPTLRTERLGTTARTYSKF